MGLLGAGGGRAEQIEPQSATLEDLLRVQSPEYVAVVMDESPTLAQDDLHGLGAGDTPRFARMHEVASLVAGATCRALDGVLDSAWATAFSPAGGLHHAHRDRAAGFCVYNDCAIAIARATALRPGLRVAYVDIDAHHGDGVEEAFSARGDVLTLSVHESGRYLYPGTGVAREIGTGLGVGATVNVPLPPHAGPAEYELVFDGIVEPALAAFAPDVIVAQLGADSHRDDPLTHLAMTVRGHASLVARLVATADRVCGGRIVAAGGGGYEVFSATPRMWASAMALLLGRDVPEELPSAWIERAEAAALAAGFPQPLARRTFDEHPERPADVPAEETHRLTELVIAEVRAVSPLLGAAR